MDGVTLIIIVLVLIVLGLNLTANNALVSLLTNYIFYKDPLAKRLIRVMGIVVALSSIFFIIGQSNIGLYVNILVLFVLTFLSIRGHNVATRKRLEARDRLLKEYQEEIRKKREKIEELKKSGVHKATKPEEHLTPDEIRKKMWDNGKMSNKEIINGLKDE